MLPSIITAIMLVVTVFAIYRWLSRLKEMNIEETIDSSVEAVEMLTSIQQIPQISPVSLVKPWRRQTKRLSAKKKLRQKRKFRRQMVAVNRKRRLQFS